MIIKSKICILLSLLITSTISTFSQYTCSNCYVKTGGQYCLDENDFTKGNCCDTSVLDSSKSAQCLAQKNERFCMTKEKIKNSELASYTCPARKDRCPSDMKDINILL